MNTALLLIDIQESFRHRPYFRAESLAPFLARTNALIDGCTSRSVPVVRILHADSDDPKNPFSLASGLVRPLEGLAPVEAAAQFVKARHSALVGTGLSVWLRKNGIGRLIVTGIRTEQCCETTTRHASDLGYQVDYVTEATLTFPMTDRHGRLWSPDEIKARTELVLHDRFARVVSVDEALTGTGVLVA